MYCDEYFVDLLGGNIVAEVGRGRWAKFVELSWHRLGGFCGDGRRKEASSGVLFGQDRVVF